MDDKEIKKLQDLLEKLIDQIKVLNFGLKIKNENDLLVYPILRMSADERKQLFP